MERLFMFCGLWWKVFVFVCLKLVFVDFVYVGIVIYKFNLIVEFKEVSYYSKKINKFNSI